jgi:hypothetical protein
MTTATANWQHIEDGKVRRIVVTFDRAACSAADRRRAA